MKDAMVWLIQAILSHLLADFVLQPSSWVRDRKEHHFASVKLYIHGTVAGATAFIILGISYWKIALLILVSHTIIDGWKSYRKDSVTYFLLDQLLHIAIITGCCYFLFYDWNSVLTHVNALHADRRLWIITTAVIFLTTPSGILIGKLTSQWRDKIEGAEGLANAGKWIGIIERLIVFVLVLQAQYSAIGLLVAAKGIIRFNDKDRQETKTEYLVIGTLLSIGAAIATGLLAKP